MRREAQGLVDAVGWVFGSEKRAASLKNILSFALFPHLFFMALEWGFFELHRCETKIVQDAFHVEV